MSFEILFAGVFATVISGISLGVYLHSVVAQPIDSRSFINMWTTGWSFLIPLALAQQILPMHDMPLDIWLYILGLWGLFSGVTSLTRRFIGDVRPRNH